MDALALALAEEFVRGNPSAADSRVLERLLQALRSGQRFDVQELYALSIANFALAMDVVNAWRLQRYYIGCAVVPAAQRISH